MGRAQIVDPPVRRQKSVPSLGRVKMDAVTVMRIRYDRRWQPAGTTYGWPGISSAWTMCDSGPVCSIAYGMGRKWTVIKCCVEHRGLLANIS